MLCDLAFLTQFWKQVKFFLSACAKSTRHRKMELRMILKMFTNFYVFDKLLIYTLIKQSF
jgi:hypothetical protein